MNVLGFFIFLSVAYACDAYLYSLGHDTFFFKHKTEQEKALREKQTGVKSDD